MVWSSSVCHFWRRTFIHYPKLWSHLNLTPEKSNIFVKTLLGRARGSGLNITSAGLESANTLVLLSSRTRQFESLCFVHHCWADIQRFVEAAPGPLPLLHILKIHVTGYNPLDPNILSCPSLPPFSSAANLKKFTLHNEGQPHLDRFTFPHLTTFELSATPEGTFSDEEGFPTTQLLDFLEAMPMLESISLAVHAEISLVGVPPERIVILPNVEKFYAVEQEPNYKISAHISCPAAQHKSLICEQDVYDLIPQEIFPASIVRGAVSIRHSASQVITLVLQLEAFEDLSCSLSFLSPGPTTFHLGYEKIATEDDEKCRSTVPGEHFELFSQDCRAIQNHPLLTNIRHLRIQDRHMPLGSDWLKHITNEVGGLF